MVLRFRCRSLVLFFAAVASSTASTYAQSAKHVAVVINDASADSQRIGDYYVQKRAIPSTNVIRIRTKPVETIERAVYTATIEQPVANAIKRESLQDRVHYIVLTKGVPLRIAGTSGAETTVASVDSELSLLYRRMAAGDLPTKGRIANPYYLGQRPVSEARAFTHGSYDIYLVTRLDGFTVDEALALIDRAQTPSSDGRIVLDQRLSLEPSGDIWLAEAAKRLKDAGQADRVLLDNSPMSAPATDRVLGYYSWGSNDFTNRKRRFGMKFVPGALAATFVSTDARTFENPPDDWSPSANWNSPASEFGGSPQTLIGDLIRDGVTGVAGHVAEPFLASTVRPQILFPAYLAGFNLAESFYMAIPHLSWQTVVIGDPLCAPFPRKAVVPADELDPPLDPTTQMPAIFSRRRLAAVVATIRADPRAVGLGLLAEGHLARNDVAGARRALEEATEIAPDVIAMQQQLALLYERSGEYAFARDRYRIILKYQPNNAAILNNLAYNLLTHERALPEAYELAKRAAVLAPTNPAVLDTVGWIEHLRGNNDAAAKILNIALQKGPASAEIRWHAAVIFAENGAYAASEVQLAEALRLDPSLAKREETAKLQARLKSRQK